MVSTYSLNILIFDETMSGSAMQFDRREAECNIKCPTLDR